jgi:hypothetical protein
MHHEYNGRVHGLPMFSYDNQTTFQVAVITAGELRSFLFVEKSWERYFLKEWKNHIKIFGHIVQTPNCPLASAGLNKFVKLATDYELSSSVPLLSAKETLSRLPPCLVTPEYRPRWEKRFSGFSRGNFVDMYARRKRAFDLAMAYAEQRSFQWDLIFFLRLDTAFYDPPLHLYSIYQVLKQYEGSSTSQPLDTPQPFQSSSPAVFIPGSCNFGGLCDRFAIGLPQTMSIFFEPDWTFQVMDWSCSPPSPDTSKTRSKSSLLSLLPINKYEGFIPTEDTIRKMKEDLTVHVPTSETILSLWMVLNNITQLNYDKNIAFATLRVEHSPGYCSLSRSDYIHHYPNQTSFIWDPDKHAMYDIASPFKDFDLIGNHEQRCGNHTRHFIRELPKICSNFPSCSCLKAFGHLYLGVT